LDLPKVISEKKAPSPKIPTQRPIKLQLPTTPKPHSRFLKS